MALQTNALTSYSTVQKKESVRETIAVVQVGDAPIFDKLRKVKEDREQFSWQIEDLPATVDSAVLEGDTYGLSALGQPTLRTNYAQINRRIYGVTGTQEAVAKYGRMSDINYKRAQYSVVIRQDAEVAITANTAQVGGNGTTIRKTASLLSWIGTNDVFGSGGASPSTLDGTATRTDGTQAAFTETMLKSALQLRFSTTRGDRNANLEMHVGPGNMDAFSAFVGRATPIQDGTTGKIAQFADIYSSNFGRISVIPNALMRTRDALLIDYDYVEIRELRPFNVEQVLQGQYDGKAERIIGEWGLAVLNEKALAGIFDLS